ncbi:hypothetical protein HA402_006456 [Bradysia odoriphaga]|nr:hypothetical protein HA402_006456 [Bradysia odoriphaga]
MPVRLNLIFASSTNLGNSHETDSNVPSANRIVSDSDNYKRKSEVPLIDVAVAIICFSLLISLALLIDANMQEAITNENHNQMVALSLIIAFLLVSIFVCIYATHRMGVCMWTGPLQSSSDDAVHQVDGEIDFSPESYIIDLPPCYKSIIEELPPSYDSVVDKCKLETNCVANVHGVNHI